MPGEDGRWMPQTTKALRDAARGTPEPVPDVLYHYTSGPGLHGILGGGAGPEASGLRAYDIRQMSDHSELNYGLEVVEEAITEAGESATDKGRLFLRNLRRVLHASTRPTLRFYAACFSRKRNDLSQWRAYGGNSSGFAIGYRTVELAVRDPGFCKVEYDADTQRARVDALLSTALKALPAAPSLRTSEGLGGETVRQFLHLAAVFKNRAYEAEDEWRLFAWRKTDVNDREVEVDGSGPRLKLYLNLGIFTPRSIREVVIGPGGDEQDQATRRLLRGFKYWEVSASDIPER